MTGTLTESLTDVLTDVLTDAPGGRWSGWLVGPVGGQLYVQGAEYSTTDFNPDPARPDPAFPDLARPSISNKERRTENGFQPDSFNAEVARERKCWACRVDEPGHEDACYRCGAPRWDNAQIVRGVWSEPGVYVLQADCSLVKIGVSKTDARHRAEKVASACGRDAGVELMACLPGAGHGIERWLHRTFAEFRDVHWAKAENLVNPTEWFWPSHALGLLLAREDFLEELAGPRDPSDRYWDVQHWVDRKASR